MLQWVKIDNWLAENYHPSQASTPEPETPHHSPTFPHTTTSEVGPTNSQVHLSDHDVPFSTSLYHSGNSSQVHLFDRDVPYSPSSHIGEQLNIGEGKIMFLVTFLIMKIFSIFRV
jgi:hypothetical protein